MTSILPRRSFLRLLGLAPIALPMAAKAAAARASPDHLFVELIQGEAMTFEPLTPLRLADSAFVELAQELARQRSEEIKMAMDMGFWSDSARLSVEDQIREHDIFDLMTDDFQVATGPS